jgi:hypothetical protein
MTIKDTLDRLQQLTSQSAPTICMPKETLQGLMLYLASLERVANMTDMLAMALTSDELDDNTLEQTWNKTESVLKAHFKRFAEG